MKTGEPELGDLPSHEGQRRKRSKEEKEISQKNENQDAMHPRVKSGCVECV